MPIDPIMFAILWTAGMWLVAYGLGLVGRENEAR